MIKFSSPLRGRYDMTDRYLFRKYNTRCRLEERAKGGQKVEENCEETSEVF